MRRTLAAIGILVMITLFAGCVSMTGKSALVDPPMDPGASMLVMEVGNKSGPYSSSMTNNGNTGWVPWVVDD